MDLKSERFEITGQFSEPREAVLTAAENAVRGQFPDREIHLVENGFCVEGPSGGHETKASFTVFSTASGADLHIELLVERSGPMGYMVADVGGFYNGQLRKWVNVVEGQLRGDGAAAETPAVSANNIRLKLGCIYLLVAIPAAYFIISGLVGVITGNLYGFGRGGEAFHGAGARIASTAILLVVAFFVYRLFKSRTKAP